VHPPVEADPDQRAGGVFHFMHGKGVLTVCGAGLPGKRSGVCDREIMRVLRKY
jgi:hypothetical protein